MEILSHALLAHGSETTKARAAEASQASKTRERRIITETTLGLTLEEWVFGSHLVSRPATAWE